jgi:hypothetical protein
MKKRQTGKGRGRGERRKKRLESRDEGIRAITKMNEDMHVTATLDSFEMQGISKK